MKKFLALTLALIFVFSLLLTSCNTEDNSDVTTANAETATTTQGPNNPDETTKVPENTTAAPNDNTVDSGSATEEQEETTNPGFIEDWEEEYNKNASVGLKFTSNGDGTCYVDGIGTCEDIEIIIPSRSPEGDKVTSIGGGAFRDCSGLTSITIPTSVTSIGNWAFGGCSGLTNITIPYRVSSIGTGSFESCTSLTSITIPNGVKSIGWHTFSDCTNLTSITIPDSVTSISFDTFDGTAYYNAESNWKSGVLYIGKHLIKAKSDISGTYSIEEGTLTIADEAFENCRSLTNITVPSSVTSIGFLAFKSYGLTSITVNHENASYYSKDNCLIETSTNTLVLGCQNSIIPSSVTSIGYHAFTACYGLTSITIPNSVTNIGEYAFSFCSDLTNITIPSSVTSIALRGFENCSDLIEITFEGTKAEWEATEKGENWNYRTGNYTVHCTDGDIAKADS